MILSLAALVSGLLALLLWRAPWLAVKPSMQFIIAANLLLQWPMALMQDRIFEGIDSPGIVAVWIALPLLAALTWIPFVGGPTSVAVRARARIRTVDRVTYAASLRILRILWVGIGVVTAWYLATVPITSTGLYVILTNPALAALAREDSLKLLTNKPLVYAYLGAALVLCPVACALSLRLIRAAWHERHMGSAVVMLASFGAALAVASLSGARSFPARVILIAVLSVWFESGMRVSLFRLIAIPSVVLIPIGLLTVLREGKAADVATVAEYVGGAVTDRMLLVPSQVGVLHLRYAQDRGDFGIAAVPKLAAIAGVAPVNPANIVGRYYFKDSGPTTFSNASFLFTYISYFGFAGVLLNILLVGALEWTMLVLSRTGPTLLAPMLAFFAVANVGYLSADYSTVLMSNGIFLAALLAITGTWLVREGAEIPALKGLRHA